MKIRKLHSQNFSTKLHFNAFKLLRKKKISQSKRKVVKPHESESVSNDEKMVKIFKSSKIMNMVESGENLVGKKPSMGKEEEMIESDRSEAELEVDCKTEMAIVDAVNNSFCAELTETELMETELMMRASLGSGRLEFQVGGMKESEAEVDDVQKYGDG